MGVGGGPVGSGGGPDESGGGMAVGTSVVEVSH